MVEREFYRVTPGEQEGLELALTPAPGETFQGAVLSLSVKGAGTLFPRDGSPALNIGERTTLRFVAPWLSKPLDIQATVRSRVEIGLFRRYGFEFEIVEGSIPEHAYRLFNRRRALRVHPLEGEVLEVTITSSSGSQVRGPLTDISTTGFGVFVQDVSFAEAENVRVAFRLRPRETTLQLQAWSRTRRLVNEDFLYGMEFDPSSEDFELHQVDISAYVMRRQNEQRTAAAQSADALRSERLLWDL